MELTCASKLKHSYFTWFTLLLIHCYRLLLALEPGIIPAKYVKPAKMPFQQVYFPVDNFVRGFYQMHFNIDGGDQRIY